MEPVKLAIFDFDGTLIPGDSIIRYIRLARRLKAIGTMGFIRILLKAPLYALGILSDSQYKSYALKFYASLSPERKVALDRVFVDEILSPLLFPQGLSALNAKKEEGFRVLVVSASTENYMQYVAQALHADGLICTRLTDKAEVILNCKGENKVTLLEEYLKKNEMDVDRDASCAFGDSKSDLPILQWVGSPIIVNGKRKLIKAAPQLPRVTWRHNQ